MAPTERASATLTIDLGAIRFNYRSLAARVRPALCAAVVKADAYGLGMAEVAPALAREGCRVFFVATPEEGVALRQFLPRAEVAVLNGVLEGDAQDFAEHGLSPVLNDLSQLARWHRLIEARLPRPAILNLDTGMTRLGLTLPEALRLADEPERARGVAIAYLMSHLAVAEEADHPLNREQLSLFLKLRARLSAALANPRASLANSSGIFLGPHYHFDLVRPGVALYGVNPTPGAANPMRAVVSLEAKILQLREIDRPLTVGYGATRAVAPGQRIATVAVGYADGIPRSASNRGFGVLAGQRVPLLGRVSMDLLTFDVSSVPLEAAQPGGTITLIGPAHSVDELAGEADTIGYEVLTRLGQRYRRRYLKDA
ncbi:MAG TPA: alanine racemase [Alphaproteobacteria bacterium]|nr:alanine racemase [Alphaproteobacteria bacterium]